MTLRVGSIAVVLCTAIVVALAQPSAAQTIVRPKADLPLRNAPPALFQGKGTLIGTAQANEPYRVIGKRTVRTITGSEQWLQIQSMNSNMQGWIFSGPSDRPDANVNGSEK